MPPPNQLVDAGVSDASNDPALQAARANRFAKPPVNDPNCHAKTLQLLGEPQDPNKLASGADVLSAVNRRGYVPADTAAGNFPDGSVAVFRNQNGSITHSIAKQDGVWYQLNKPAPLHGIEGKVTTGKSIGDIQNTYFKTNEGELVPAGWNKDKPEVYVLPGGRTAATPGASPAKPTPAGAWGK